MRTVLSLLYLLLALASSAQDIPQQAWLAQYFDARGNVISTRVEDTIKHDFNKVVMEGVQKEGLGARWIGDFQYDQAYTMKVTSDKSMRILVDNGIIISDLNNSVKNTYSVTIQPNEVRRVLIEYNLNHRVVFSGDSTFVDDSEQDKIIYYGNWRISDTLAIPEQEGNCYCSWSQSANDSLVFRFTKATGFAWIGERMSHHGVAEVYLNDQYMGLIDTYAPNNTRLTINWAINQLDTAKVYKFKLLSKGTKNPASTGTAVVIQGFVLKNKDYVPPEPPIDLNNPVYLDGLTITASGYEDDGTRLNPPIQAYDNDIATRWSSLGIGEWLELKYDEPQTFSGVDLAFLKAGQSYFFDIMVDADTVLKDQASTPDADFINYSFDLKQGSTLTYIGKGNNTSNWNSVVEIVPVIVEPPIEPPDPPLPPVDAQMDIVRQGYYIVLVDGVQLGGGHSEYDKAVEKAVNAALADPNANVLIQAPTWRVEYR